MQYFVIHLEASMAFQGYIDNLAFIILKIYYFVFHKYGL